MAGQIVPWNQDEMILALQRTMNHHAGELFFLREDYRVPHSPDSVEGLFDPGGAVTQSRTYVGVLVGGAIVYIEDKTEPLFGVIPLYDNHAVITDIREHPLPGRMISQKYGQIDEGERMNLILEITDVVRLDRNSDAFFTGLPVSPESSKPKQGYDRSYLQFVPGTGPAIRYFARLTGKDDMKRLHDPTNLDVLYKFLG